MRRWWWIRVLAMLTCLVMLGGGLPRPARAAASDWEWVGLGAPPVLYDNDEQVQTYVAPPAQAAVVRAQAATITVEYEGFPPEAQASFQYAVDIWQSLLVAPLPIRIRATWTQLGAGILGGAGPTGLYRNTTNNTWYPPALAKQLMNRDPRPTAPDIFAQFTSSGVQWYFGNGQAPAGQYNFTTVVLHELGHGLGMSDSFDVEGGAGAWGEDGYPVIFDRAVIDASGASLLDTARYANPSATLAATLQGGQLFFNGPAATAANGGSAARLFAPNPFQRGSSVAHLDDRTYPPGSPNSLMTSRLSRGETNYNPGPIALGLLADIGWGVTNAPPQPTAQPSATPSSSPSAGSRCFAETSQCIGGAFLAYWDAHGGLPINGYPLTGERVEKLEDGKQYTVQWFERVRMEFHPENLAPNNVLLGQFGRQIHPLDPPVAQKAGHSFFPQTGHNMPLDFFDFWNKNGGVSQFGFPLTEEFTEKLEDGRSYTVQYTERARFERHPENGFINTVLLGQFGRRLLAGGGVSPAPSASPVPSRSPAPSGSPAPRTGAQITISPQQGPNGALFVVTGVGFAPNTTYYIRVASPDGQRQINFDDAKMQSDEDGIVLAGFSFEAATPAGTYVASVATAATGGTVIATVQFNLTGPNGAKPGPSVVITPSQAKGGTTFILTGTGFAPNTAYTLRVQSEDRKLTINFNNSDLKSDADGVILTGFSLASARPAGVYIAEVVSKGANPAVLAGAKFTLLAASALVPEGSVGALAAPELAGWLVPVDGLVVR